LLKSLPIAIFFTKIIEGKSIRNQTYLLPENTILRPRYGASKIRSRPT